MTPSQLQDLKTSIQADPVLSLLPNTADANFDIAVAYNQPANPTFFVWRSTVEVQEIMSNGFVWTAVDALTVGKARIWDWMTRFGEINPSKANVRQGLVDCFGGGSAMVTAVLPHCRRPATRVERLFATGAGTAASPGTMVFEGTVSYQDVTSARNLP